MLCKLICCGVAVFFCICGFAQSDKDYLIGGISHYFPGQASAQEDLRSFKVDELVSSVQAARLDYFVFTLGQNSGQYNSYNRKLIELCNEYKSRSVDRSIVLEIASALKKVGVKFFLYIPIRAPQSDDVLKKCLNDYDERIAPSDEFIYKWGEVIGFWSKELGGDLDGWWFDGAYNLGDINSQEWREFCLKVMDGNQYRSVAFNSGQGVELVNKRGLPCQNLWAGEINDPIKYFDGIDKKTLNSMRFHLITPLGDGWGKSGVRFNFQDAIKIIEMVKRKKGLVTFDFHMDRDGALNKDQVLFVGNVRYLFSNLID